MNLPGLLVAVVLYSILAAIGEMILWHKWKSLTESGVQPVFPLSTRHTIPLPIDRKSTTAAAAEVVALWPAVEEAVYRIVPYLAAGLPGAVAMVPVWAFTHAAKFYEYNRHLPDKVYMDFLKVYLASLSLIGMGLALSIPLSGELWIPIPLHMATNYAALQSLRRLAEPPKKPQFLRQTTQPRRPNQGTASRPVFKSAGVGRVRTEYLD
ncbi:MAG: hypothetical protein ABWK01_07965 [Infirmifilum sp.]